MREDPWTEWRTFLAFLTASVMAFDGLARCSGTGLERVHYLDGSFLSIRIRRRNIAGQ